MHGLKCAPAPEDVRAGGGDCSRRRPKAATGSAGRSCTRVATAAGDARLTSWCSRYERALSIPVRNPVELSARGPVFVAPQRRRICDHSTPKATIHRLFVSARRHSVRLTSTIMPRSRTSNRRKSSFKKVSVKPRDKKKLHGASASKTPRWSMTQKLLGLPTTSVWVCLLTQIKSVLNKTKQRSLASHLG